jgi:hypothetical protein
MKKILAALLVLALVAPAIADVAITSSFDNTSKNLTISFAPTAATVRGIAVTVTVTGGVVDAYASSSFNTFVDYAFNGPITPYAIGAGHPLALAASAGVATLPIADGTPFAVSVGYLDTAGAQAGLTSAGTVAVLHIGSIAPAGGTVAVVANAARGGAVVGDTIGAVTVTGTTIPVQAVNYNLTTATTTGGTVTDPGIGVFSKSGTANLVASANASWFFWKWTGDTGTIANPNAASTTIVMDAAKSVTANFTYSCQQFNFTKLLGGTDNAVNATDLNSMITWVNANKTGTSFAVGSTNPNWNPNGPIYNLTKKMGAADNTVNVSDLNALIDFVNKRKTSTSFAVNCATCGC